MKGTVVTIGLILCTALGAAAEDAPPGHFVPSDLPSGIIDGFTEAILNDSAWIVSEELAGTPHIMTAEERFVWAGSDLKAEIQLGNSTVKFSRPTSKARHEDAFTIEINFELSRIILRSSAPADVRQLVGIALPFSADRSFQKFIAGEGDTGFVALIPKKAPSDWHGIAICPRSRFDDRQQHSLSPTNFVVESIKLSPIQGELTAKQRTGFSKGTIEGQILTSSNVPRTIPFERNVTAEDPTLGIRYFVDKDDTAAAAVTLPYSGIRMFGHMTSSRGEHRFKKIEAFVRAIPFSPTKPITYYQDGASYSVDAGQCFAIIRGVLFDEGFSASKSENAPQQIEDRAHTKNPTKKTSNVQSPGPQH